MNVKFQRGMPAVRAIAGFTMVEIAICLAVIAFALVAIIGVLPTGMSVQRDNREQTIVNFDAAYLMSTIRSGAQGQDNLTNYVIAITNVYSLYGTNGTLVSTVTNWFTTNQTFANGSLLPYSILTNGFNIVGLLSTPRYLFTNSNTQYYSNTVTADFIAMSGNAVDQGHSKTSKDFAFSYRVNVEINRGADYAYNPLPLAGVNGADANWMNLTAPAPGSASLPDFIGAHLNTRMLAHNLQANSYEVRLRFRWPILATGKTGGGSVVFRSSAAGQRNDDNSIIPGLTYYHLVPLSFTGPQ